MESKKFDKEIFQVTLLLDSLEPFMKVYEYNAEVKRLMSEGVLYVIAMSEIQREISSPIFEPTLEFQDTLKSIDSVVKRYVKDVFMFFEAHKLKARRK